MPLEISSGSMADVSTFVSHLKDFIELLLSIPPLKITLNTTFVFSTNNTIELTNITVDCPAALLMDFNSGKILYEIYSHE